MDGKALIVVVVDRFSKYNIFVAIHALCSSEIATVLIYKYFVKTFGVLLVL